MPVMCGSEGCVATFVGFEVRRHHENTILYGKQHLHPTFDAKGLAGGPRDLGFGVWVWDFEFWVCGLWFGVWSRGDDGGGEDGNKCVYCLRSLAHVKVNRLMQLLLFSLPLPLLLISHAHLHHYHFHPSVRSHPSNFPVLHRFRPPVRTRFL